MSPLNSPENFWAGVDKGGPDGCWLWKRFIDHGGYGMVWWHGRQHRAHRIAYQLVKGPIPDGLQLDHLCRTRACVNPDHLEPVTNRENMLRGISLQAENARKTHCVNGHPFDEVNTGRRKDGRRCLACRRAKWPAEAVQRQARRERARRAN